MSMGNIIYKDFYITLWHVFPTTLYWLQMLWSNRNIYSIKKNNKQQIQRFPGKTFFRIMLQIGL